MRKLIFTSAILLGGIAFAQQQPALSTTINTPHLTNFALAGTNEVAQIELITRLHWVGYENNPTTVFANGFVTLGANKGKFNSEKNLFSSPERTMGVFKHVLGGTVMYDRTGLLNNTHIRFNYGIHLPITQKLTVSATLGAGYGNMFFNGSKARVVDQSDVYLPQMASMNQSVFQTTAGIGIYTQRLTAGLSINQLVKTAVKYDDLLTTGMYNPHLTANLSYEFTAGNISITPQAMLRTSRDLKTIADFGAQIQYNRALWLGIYGRTTKAMSIQLGANLFKSAYISYAVDFPFGKVMNVSNTSHEVRLGIYLGKKVKSKLLKKSSKPEDKSNSNKENDAKKYAEEDSVE